MSNSLYREKSAVISECGVYRYRLTRFWEEEKPGALWIMLNPSTADAKEDDATIRLCARYSQSWGCGSLWVVNLFALRATNPAELLTAADPVGPDNDTHIRDALQRHQGRGDIIIAAWGAQAIRRELRPRRDQVIEMLPLADLDCLGVTASGEPRHPLYCSAAVTPTHYDLPEVKERCR